MLWPGLSLLIEDLLLMYWAVWLVLAEVHFAALKSVSQFCRMCFLCFVIVLLSWVLVDEFLRLSQLIDPCAGTNSWSDCINSSSTVLVCFLSTGAHGYRWDERLYKGWGETRIFAYASASADPVERCLIPLAISGFESTAEGWNRCLFSKALESPISRLILLLESRCQSRWIQKWWE